MEEENSNMKKHPNLPSQYVTLLQLQERWVKEKQRKLKEEEEEEEEAAKQKQKQKQEENQESEQKPEDVPPIGRISKQRYSWRSRNFKVVDAGAHRKETNAAVSASVLVEENGNESGVNKEVRSEDLRNKKKKKWWNKKKKIEKAGEEARAQNNEKGEEEEEQEQEEMARDTHAPPVIRARRSEKKSETGVAYGPNINDVSETGDANVEEIEGKFGDLSIGKASDRLSLQRQNRVINHGDRAYRGYNSGVYRGNRHYRGGCDIGAHRGTGHRKGGNWNLNRGNGQGTGGYRRSNGSRERNVERGGMVWVRKEEGADGGASGDVAENQSSGGLFRELE